MNDGLKTYRFTATGCFPTPEIVEWFFATTEDEARGMWEESCHRSGIDVTKADVKVRECDPDTLVPLAGHDRVHLSQEVAEFNSVVALIDHVTKGRFDTLGPEALFDELIRHGLGFEARTMRDAGEALGYFGRV